MKHGIAEAEWNDYLDGAAATDIRDRIEAHLFGCLECWEIYDRLAGATRELNQAGEQARQRLTLDDRQLHTMLRGVFAQLRDGAAQTQMQRRLSLLEKVLAPFCGPQAAVRALHAAAQQSPARSLERLTTEDWEPFLKRLTHIAAAMCGESFASLVWERGRH